MKSMGVNMSNPVAQMVMAGPTIKRKRGRPKITNPGPDAIRMRKVYEKRKRETGYTALGKKRGKYTACTKTPRPAALWRTPISGYLHNGVWRWA